MQVVCAVYEQRFFMSMYIQTPGPLSPWEILTYIKGLNMSDKDLLYLG